MGHKLNLSEKYPIYIDFDILLICLFLTEPRLRQKRALLRDLKNGKTTNIRSIQN